jgi:hypothetical protein
LQSSKKSEIQQLAMLFPSPSIPLHSSHSHTHRTTSHSAYSRPSPHHTDWIVKPQRTGHDDRDAFVTARGSAVRVGVLFALPTTPRSIDSVFDTTAKRDGINAGA